MAQAIFSARKVSVDSSVAVAARVLSKKYWKRVKELYPDDEIRKEFNKSWPDFTSLIGDIADEMGETGVQALNALQKAWDLNKKEWTAFQYHDAEDTDKYPDSDGRLGWLDSTLDDESGVLIHAFNLLAMTKAIKSESKGRLKV